MDKTADKVQTTTHIKKELKFKLDLSEDVRRYLEDGYTIVDIWTNGNYKEQSKPYVSIELTMNKETVVKFEG